MAPAKKSVARVAEEGFALLRAPAHVTAATAGGVEYRVEGGLIEVPEAHATELLPHGFELLPVTAPVSSLPDAPASA